MSVPDTIYAGDTLEFAVSVPEFPPSAGWVLKYRLTPRFTTPPMSPVTLTAGVDAGVYVVLVGPAVTQGWVPGAYGWARWVEQSGARQVLDDFESRGQLVILPDPAASAQGADNRTQAQKGLDDARAALAAAQAAAATGGGRQAVELTVGDRRVKYADPEQAIAAAREAVNYWTRALDAENARAAGRPTGPLGRVTYAVPHG